MSMVLRRLSALVLMLAMTASPLALTLCRVECAMAEASQTSASTHHSCHEDSAPAALTLTAVPHMCGHGDDAPSGLEQALQAVAAPFAIVPVVVWTPPVISGPVLVADVQYSPPRSFQLISQLRV